MSDYTRTPNLGLYKPNYALDVGQWGNHLNANADVLDATAGSVINVLAFGAKGDGVTDDTAAIQSVLNTYAGKAVVIIPDTGSAYICDPLLPPAGSEILIFGTLKLAPASPHSLIRILNVDNVTIRGHGTLDGNRAANSTPGVATLEVTNASNVRISGGLTLRDAAFWNLNVATSSKVLVDGIHMIGGRNANEFAAGSDDCWLTNCTIDGPDSDIGFSFYGGVTNSGAIGNTVKNAGAIGAVTAVGINVLADSGQPATCANIVIASNIIHDCSGPGIEIYGVGGSGWHDGIVIADNRCYNNGRSGVGNRGDIHVQDVTNVTVTGNNSGNFGSSAQPYYGIFVGNSVGGINVTGNTVYGVGHGGGGSVGVGLQLNSPRKLLVSGNYFYDNDTAPTMAAAMSGNAGGKSAFIGNYTESLAVTVVPSADTVILKSLALTGWGAPTGTATRATFATGSVTLPVLAEHVKALIDDLMTCGALRP